MMMQIKHQQYLERQINLAFHLLPCCNVFHHSLKHYSYLSTQSLIKESENKYNKSITNPHSHLRQTGSPRDEHGKSSLLYFPSTVMRSLNLP